MQIMQLMKMFGAVFLMAVVAVGSTAYAQDAVPAYLAINGHLYRWTAAEGLVREEACDTFDTRVIRLSASPDGRYLALNLVSEDFFQQGGAPTPRGDLVVCDVANDVLRPLTEGNMNNTASSLRGVWSPDGTLLGWTQVNPDQDSVAIRLYNPATDEITTLVESTPLHYGCGVGAFPPDMSWSSRGIAVPYWVSSEEDFCVSQQTGVYVYDDTNGTLIADLSVGDQRTDGSLDDVIWVADGQLLVSSWNASSDYDYQLVTLDGRTTPTNGGTEWVSARDGIPLRSLLPFAPGGNTGSGINVISVGMADDGSAALMIAATNLYAAFQGEIQVIDLRTVIEEPVLWQWHDIGWGQMRLQLNANMAQAVQCSQTDPIRYSNRSGRVVSGLGVNNLRALPMSSGELLGQIPEGGQVEVLHETSICNSGVVWRYVCYDGVAGWTAESQGADIYLERLETSGRGQGGCPVPGMRG